MSECCPPAIQSTKGQIKDSTISCLKQADSINPNWQSVKPVLLNWKTGNLAKMKIFRKYILLFLWTVLLHTEETNSKAEDSSDVEVDVFINEYVKEVKRTLRVGLEQHVISKRSPSHPDIDLNKLTGPELLVGFQEMYTVPARFPRDLILFSHCLPDQKQWYSAALETKPEDLQATMLVLYKYQGHEWKETYRVKAARGMSIAVEQIRDSVYLVVAQHLAEEGLGSTVWHLLSDSDRLEFMHMLPTHLASHAIMWTDTYTYAAVAISENPEGSQSRFSTLSPVYRWLGNSFDMIDELPTHNPQALVQFNIRSSIFVAVANFQNDLGETQVDSEIFRYDLTSGKFNVYQRLPTEAAVDIKYFCFQSNQIAESFLIHASKFHTDEKGNKDYNSPSVVYKLSDEEYFVPFQALRVAKVTSWQPVQHLKDGLESLTLIGASDEGIVSFQYDGWRFVSTGLHYDKSSFGPGPKSLNVFYFNNEAFISVANKESNSFDTNVFIPVFKHHPGVENLQKMIAEWVDVMTQEMIEVGAKMSELTRIAQEAPSVNDPVIQLGSHAKFINAEIHKLETIATDVGDSDTDAEAYSKLYELKHQLVELNNTLEELPNRIGQTSFNSITIYQDRKEDSVNITCINSCHAQELEVINVNGENLSEFLINTVNVKEPVEFRGEVAFSDLALTEPLNTKMINGHMKETLIDWTKEVIIEHKLKVEGDVVAKDAISTSDALGGVLINIGREEEVIISPTTYVESLNTSQLMLSDGKLSEVNFKKFVMSTLRKHGNQVFSEFQDIDRVEADEVSADLYKAVSPPPTLNQQRNCEGENCSDDRKLPDDVVSIARASGGDQKIESINLLNDVIIIPRNITLFGKVIVENGSLSAKDFVDLKHNVSAVELSEFSIPLNQTVIRQHFKFNGELETPMLNTDTLNSLPVTSLVKLEEEDAVRVSGKKTFQGPLAVDGILHVTGLINGVGLKDVEDEEEDPDQLDLDYLHVKGVNSTNMRLGENDWQKRAIKNKNGVIIFNTLNVEENVSAKGVMVGGNINNYHLENLLNDTVFQGDDDLLITGTKHFIGECEIQSLNVETSNATNVHFVSPESQWRKRLMQAKSVQVDKLFYTGDLDGIESWKFGTWLLTEGDQSVTASQTINSLEALHMAMSPDATFNSINITHLLTQAVLISDNTTFDSVIFEKPVTSSEVEVGGKLSGLSIPADILTADPTVDQLISGHKRVTGSVSVTGDLLTYGLVSNINLTAYCQALSSNESSLVISGNAKFKQEPEILISVNHIEWSDVMRSIWFKEDNVTILEKVSMNEVEFEQLAVKNINNNNVEEQLSRLVSLSKDQDISGTFYFSNVLAGKGLKADETTVGGDVQGLQLPSFTKNVLLNGPNQEIEGYIDFKSITIKKLDNRWFLNGLNISSDLMLANVASNTVTSELTLEKLVINTLRLPPGALVAGVDISLWNGNAVTKSGSKNVINGDVTIRGSLDSSQGIRVEHMVNGIPFDQNHLLMSNGYQEVTGKKYFSPQSDLTVHLLKVDGFLNDLNISDFYHQQVTANDNVRISGYKQFTAPLWSRRVVLPEIYQDHNLTWLESQLSAPLPWSNYYSQLANIETSHQLAERSLAGRAYYLKNMTRAQDVEGDVLFTLPFKNGNSTVLGVMRRQPLPTEGHRLTLSLLHWNDKQDMFMQIPGSVNYFPRVVPSEVQMITLPGGELAAYVTSYLPHNTTSTVGHANLFRLKDGGVTQTTVYGGKPGSTLLSFLDYKARTCFVVVGERCRVHCHTEGRPTVRLPSFPCQNITKATLFTTDRGTYVVGVQATALGSLLLWRMSGRRFTLVQELPQFNPVSIAATTTAGPHVAVANVHLLGHSQPETVDIYRFDENTSQLQLQQSVPVVFPRQVVFTSLPTSESVLYVASVVAPLQVYIYRGILGYQLLTTDPTLPVPSDLQPFTDHHQRHFLLVPSGHTASVLKGQFVGPSEPSAP